MNTEDWPVFFQIKEDVWVDPRRIVGFQQFDAMEPKPTVEVWVSPSMTFIVPGTVAQFVQRLTETLAALQEQDTDT